jgi:hypothetical protein
MGLMASNHKRAIEAKMMHILFFVLFLNENAPTSTRKWQMCVIKINFSHFFNAFLGN